MHTAIQQYTRYVHVYAEQDFLASLFIYNTCSSGRLGVGLACQFFRASAPRCERSSGLRRRVMLPYNQRTLALSDLFLRRGSDGGSRERGGVLSSGH